MFPRVIVVASAILILLSGCGGTPPPHGRMGALPFPGAWTLYGAANPEKLGHHR
jgi:hypothetical protein